MNDKSNERLSWGTKLGFGAGDIFGGGAMVIIGFFYLFFLTDVLLISPVLAGVVFLVSKMWDAVSDPIMGIISDRTRTRFGRRRPYFLLGVVLVFLSFFMMWFPVDFERETHRFIFVLAAYIFFSTSYTIVMIPYLALASELTTDYNERTALTSVRMVFSMVSSLVCAVLPLEIVKTFPEVRTGYIVMALVFASLFSLPFLATFFATKERPEFQKEPETFNFKRTFVEPFKTPTFIHVLLMYLFSMATMDIVMSIMMYFMTYYIKRPDEANYVLGALLIAQIVAIPLFAVISGKIGKKRTFVYAAIMWLVTMCFSLLITPDNHDIVIYVFCAIVGIGSGGIVVMIYSILPDVPDVDELYSERRREGIFSGLMTFLRKASSALGIFIVSQIIFWAGYLKPVETIIDGKAVIERQAQTPEFLISLKIMFALVPALFLSIAIISAIRYRLTPEVHDRLNITLTARRRGKDYNKTEEQQLKKTLEGE
ncbi:MAG: MFS transporter [Deltaproteobacteria bacterium]|nr:MFS transporter [Candidatus Zymogenaceae bacterium]